MSKLKTLKPLQPKVIQADTMSDIISKSLARWDRMWDLVDAVKQSLHTTDIEGFSEPQLEKALQACLDKKDFGIERKNIQGTITFKELVKRMPKPSVVLVAKKVKK